MTRSLFLLLCAFITLTACSKPETTDSTAGSQPQGRVVKGDTTIVDELLDKAGLNAQISYLPTSIMNRADDQLRRGIVDVDTVRDILNETYNPAALRSGVRVYLLDSLSEAQAKDMVQWLDTDLGKKITNLEVAGSKPNMIHHVMGKYHELANNSPRVAMVGELEKVTGATEHSINLALAVERSLQLALNQRLPEVNQISEAEMLSEEPEKRLQMQQRFSKIVEATYLYNYQSLSDDELSKYISFSQSDTAKAYHRLVSEAFQKAVSSAGKKASLKIAALNAG